MQVCKAGRRGTWLLFCSLAVGSQLPVRVYSTADGLRNNSINRITTDSRGFLWFSTSDGASRFDGYQFLNLTVRDGLSHRRVNDVLETRDGAFWFATARGLCRLGKTGASARMIDAVYFPPGSSSVTRLLEPQMSPRAGAEIWCGTDTGLYRFHSRDGRFEAVPLPAAPGARQPYIFDLFEDRTGTLWIGADQGLFRYGRDGAITARITIREGLPADQVTAVREDASGALWATTWMGAARLSRGRVNLVLRRRNGLAAEYLYALLPRSNGDLWLAGTGGIAMVDGNGAVRGRVRGKDGLVVDDIEALAQDRDGNIWVGTDGAGAIKLAQTGFTTYSRDDRILGRPAAILESRQRELVLLTKTDALLRIYSRRNGQFHLLRTLSSPHGFPWGTGQIGLQAADGDWWIATGEGVSRFPASGAAREVIVSSAVSGPPLKLFQDSHGDIWMAFRKPGPPGLARWHRSSGRVEQIVADAGPAAPSSFPFVFAEDRRGNVWIGYFQGPLMRYRSGHLREVALPAQAARGIRSLLVDSRDRLWVGTSEAGLLQLDNTDADQPRLVADSGRPSLSGDIIECLAEDAFRRIYACTNRGLDVLDPESNDLRRYTAEDGLVRGNLQLALRDRAGALWFASSLGISQLVPQSARSSPGPYVQISRLEIAGIPREISRLGEQRVAGVRLPFGAGPVRIEVTGITFRPGDVLRYQTRLDGVDREWSTPSPDRVATYAALAPGSYRFQARAVTPEGVVSASAAEVEFAVLPPIWRRWWFLSLTGAVLAAAVVSAHRMRVARLMQIVQVRNRISSDLHDDIGATLSQIVILSEVARRESADTVQSSLGRISELSRQVLESMSDIIWAVSPARDYSTELIQRMRRFATDVLTTAEIDFTFRVNPGTAEVPTHPAVRRELLLIFKEAINNTLKHAAAKHVEVRLWARRDLFGFEIADDGRGFDRAALSGEGNGLRSMEKRACQLRGACTIASRPGEGTVVKVEIPIRRMPAYRNR